MKLLPLLTAIGWLSCSCMAANEVELSSAKTPDFASVYTIDDVNNSGEPSSPEYLLRLSKLSTPLYIGDVGQINMPGTIRKGFLLFRLPPQEGSRMPKRATLRLYLSGMQSEAGTLPSVLLFHAEKWRDEAWQADGDLHGLQTSHWADNKAFSKKIPLCGPDSEPGFIELDVTEMIQSDYRRNAQPIAAFRMEVDDQKSLDPHDGLRNNYQFWGSDMVQDPQKLPTLIHPTQGRADTQPGMVQQDPDKVPTLVLSFAELTDTPILATEAIAISDEKGELAAILDGESSTKWTSKIPGAQDISVDLEHPWPVRSVEIEWGENYPSEYEVQLTDDGKTWKTVARSIFFKKPEAKGITDSKFIVHKIKPTKNATGIRLRCLKADKGVEIVDLRINGQFAFCYEPVPADAICLNKTADPEARVRDLLARMTVREKLGMVTNIDFYYIPGIERFGFAPVLMSDATSGFNVRPGRGPLTKSTSFPLASALAATWQPELAFKMGKAIGKECRGGGVGVLLGPGVNIHRTSTGGRNFEYLGEDPWLASRMAVEHIKGVQSQKVIAVIKHLIANESEFVRTSCNSVVDERTLHEIYLPAFAAAVREANVRAVMSSYNWLNGEKCGDDKTLLTDLLRGGLGHTGMVMSDWFVGVHDQAKMLGSGQNLVNPDWAGLRQTIRAQLEKDPEGAAKQLDAMIEPTLRVLFEMGIWDRPVADSTFENAKLDEHKVLSRSIAESAVTVLKNEGVLPLAKGQKILIVGDKKAVEASHSGLGSGLVYGYDQVNFFAGLKAVFGDDVAYEANPTDEMVKNADRVLYFFNMGDVEGWDRPFELPEATNRQIQSLASKNPNVIVIASTGTAFGTPWLDSVKGLVHGYYLGQEYGAAMANVLSGKVTPSGKLPFTMEKSFADSPAYGYNVVDGKPWWLSTEMPPNIKTTTIDVPYSEGIFVGYRWYEAKKKPVNFHFGFGLSYTTFKIGDLKVSADTIAKDKPINVSVTVTNTGKVAGAEVVQLYVHDEESSVERPYRELKGFQKVFLQPGERQTVTMPLDWKALAFWDVKTKSWVAEPGAFTLLVGNSSRDVQCQSRVTYK